MDKLVIYIDPFDPFTLVHLERVELIKKQLQNNLKAIILCPNNSLKADNPLHYRCSLMSRMLPVYMDTEFLSQDGLIPETKVVVYNNHTDSLFKLLNGYETIGITTDNSIIKNTASFCRWIPFDNIKYHQINPSNIKQSLPKSISIVYHPYTIGLSRRRLGNYIIGDEFVKEFKNEENTMEYVKRMKLWIDNVPQDIIKSPKLLKVEDHRVHMSLFKDYVPFIDFVVKRDPDLDQLFKEYFKKLQQLHTWLERNRIVIQGDMNPTNILIKRKDGILDFAIVDFDLTRYGDSEDLIREWHQFWFSLDYFFLIYGVHINNDTLNHWKRIGRKLYTFRKGYPKGIHQKWRDYWYKMKTDTILDRKDFSDEYPSN